MADFYKFWSPTCAMCPMLDRELARVVGAEKATPIDASTEEGRALATALGVKSLPTLVKTVQVKGEEEVQDSLVGWRYSREVLEKFFRED